MRITGIRKTPVAVPLRVDEAWSFGRTSSKECVLIELETDEGVTGLGEAFGYPTTGAVLAAIEAVEPLITGENPLAIERIVRLMNVAGGWHAGRQTSPGLAGIEMACWDILGQVCSQPLVTLFGGPVRDSVEYVYYVALADTAVMQAEARRGSELGFRAFYMKVGADDPAEDIARVEAVRAGAGPNAAIRVDANEAWTPAAAVRIMRELERFDLEYVEQPVSGHNKNAMEYVRSRIATPLLTNESTWTRHDVLEVIASGVADAISLDNQLDGGLWNMKICAALCEIAGLPAVKHSPGELGIAETAAAHVAAASPAFLLPSQSYVSLLADDVIAPRSGRNWNGGRLSLPAEPGIGVRLDPDRVARYSEAYERGRVESPGTGIRSTPMVPRQ